jgi:hypothetical protein
VNRGQFDHAVRAAAAVAGVSEVVVIGSQAAHASLSGELPEPAMRSVEADIVIRGDIDGEKADLVDGSIGEASMFHQTFGFYAQGVSIETAILADAGKIGSSGTRVQLQTGWSRGASRSRICSSRRRWLGERRTSSSSGRFSISKP